MSDRDNIPAEEDPAALRAELARVQEAARRSLSHLRDEVDFLRESQDPGRDVDSVTKQVALEQELDTLRRTLLEKERLVDASETQCRRLEDELEDQHLAYEGLKRDLERNKLSLSAAQKRMERESQEREALDQRYQTLLSSKKPGVLSEEVEERLRPVPAKSGSAGRFLGGLVAGILLSAVGLWVWVQLDSWSLPDVRPSSVREAPSPAPASNGPEPVDASPPAAEDAQTVAGKALVPRRVRDRLSDGSAGPSMLVLEGGDFAMGRQMALAADDEGPVHSVHIEGFLIGATEVTFEEYDRFARATGRRLPSDFGWGRGSRPVVDVSWGDARAYAQWLSRKTGRSYRLPSESEWEYAAAAGQRSFFWWGNESAQGRAVCFDCGTRWDNLSTAPVGTFEPNPFGLYNTAGNVMEWVEDCYQPNYLGAPSNGLPWGAENCRMRVARGGAFNKPARSMHSTARHHFAPVTQLNAIGFRLARDG